jgi:hypothetical protein
MPAWVDIVADVLFVAAMIAAEWRIRRERKVFEAGAKKMADDHAERVTEEHRHGLQQGAQTMLNALKANGYLDPAVQCSIFVGDTQEECERQADAAFLRSMHVKPGDSGEEKK